MRDTAGAYCAGRFRKFLCVSAAAWQPRRLCLRCSLCAHDERIAFERRYGTLCTVREGQRSTGRSLHRPYDAVHLDRALAAFRDGREQLDALTDEAVAVCCHMAVELAQHERPRKDEQRKCKHNEDEQLPPERQRRKREKDHDTCTACKPDGSECKRKGFNHNADDCHCNPYPRRIVPDKIYHSSIMQRSCRKVNAAAGKNAGLFRTGLLSMISHTGILSAGSFLPNLLQMSICWVIVRTDNPWAERTGMPLCSAPP